jgi:hypothetical protein
MDTETEMFEFADITPLHFCMFWGGCRAKFTKEGLDTPDELLTGILGAAACIKQRE